MFGSIRDALRDESTKTAAEVSSGERRHEARGLCRLCYRKEFEKRPDPEQQRQRYKANPDLYRNRNLQNQYGITLDEYNILHEGQGGLCAVCYKPETRAIKGKTIPLAVDHCHITNRFRGLLCGACNVALGMLEENPDRMRALATYIEAANQEG